MAWLAIIWLVIYKVMFYDVCVSKCEEYRSILQCDYADSCKQVCIFSPNNYSCN